MWLLYSLSAAAFWALSNVCDSLLIRHFEKHPVVVQCIQSFLSIVVLSALAFILDVGTPWLIPLLLAGLIAFCGDLVFLRALDRIDVSLTNIAWAIQAVIISVAGFALFQESWNALQAVGAVLVVASVGLLFRRQVMDRRAIGLLLVMAALGAPFFLIGKYVSLQGERFLPIFFWPLFGRDCFSFVFPWFVPSYRRALRQSYVRWGWKYFLFAASVTALFLVALALNTLAYLSGPASLVAISGNVQPFFVIVFAWLCVRLFPRHAPRELLSKESLLIKLLTFSLIFIGLALLTSHQ